MQYEIVMIRREHITDSSLELQVPKHWLASAFLMSDRNRSSLLNTKLAVDQERLCQKVADHGYVVQGSTD